MKPIRLLLLLSIWVCAGCLKTRNEVTGAQTQQVFRQELANMQKARADTEVRIQELQKSFRQLNGHVEVLQHKVQRLSGMQTGPTAAGEESLEKRLAMLETTVTYLEEELVERGKKKNASSQTQAPNANLSEFDKANWYFDKEDWKRAIRAYQKYRTNRPQGRRYAMATYRIGVCFQELGLINDARVFFQEVIQSFPGTSSARKAKYRLDNL